MGSLFGGKDKRTPIPSPVVEPEEEPVITEDDPERQAKRRGRLALINTSPQGILGTPSTGRKRLLS